MPLEPGVILAFVSVEVVEDDITLLGGGSGADQTLHIRFCQARSVADTHGPHPTQATALLMNFNVAIRCCVAASHEHVDWEARQLARQIAEAFELAVGAAILHLEMTP